MSEVTMKSTKQQIFDAYVEMKEKALNNKVDFDPKAEAEKVRLESVLKNAEAAISDNFLNPEFVQKYKDLKEAIDLKEKELNELMETENVVFSFAEMLNTYNMKEKELKENHTKMVEEMRSELAAEKAKIAEELEEAKSLAKKKEVEYKTQLEEAKMELDKQRKREEEEYQYNLNRTHKELDDKWEEKKTKREAELAAREKEIQDQEDYIQGLEEANEMLHENIISLKAEKECEYQKGLKEGKEKAGKEYAFEKKALEKENEHQKAMSDATIQQLEQRLAEKDAESKSYAEKLDEAYRKMNELATTTAQQIGTTKIISTSNDGK